MARPRTVSDEQIIEATRRLARLHGPQVSVDAIATDIGVSGQAVLKRFGSRKALLVQAFRPPPMPQVLTTIHDGPDGRPFATQLSELAHDMTALFAAQAQDFAVLRWTPADIRESLMPPDTDPTPVVAVKLVTSWFQRCTQAGLARPYIDCESAAIALLGALQIRAVLEFSVGQKPGHADESVYVASIVDLFVHAVGHPGHATG